MSEDGKEEKEKGSAAQCYTAQESDVMIKTLCRRGRDVCGMLLGKGEGGESGVVMSKKKE